MGRDMDWLTGVGGFPCTLWIAVASGRRGADGAVGGLCAAAPQGGSVLVCALPLAGGTKKMTSEGAASIGAKMPPRRAGGCGMALLGCGAVAGDSLLF